MPPPAGRQAVDGVWRGTDSTNAAFTRMVDEGETLDHRLPMLKMFLVMACVLDFKINDTDCPEPRYFNFFSDVRSVLVEDGEPAQI